jgi:hypothetical protein
MPMFASRGAYVGKPLQLAAVEPRPVFTTAYEDISVVREAFTLTRNLTVAWLSTNG